MPLYKSVKNNYKHGRTPKTYTKPNKVIDESDLAYSSLVVAFYWALGEPDTIEYGSYNDLDGYGKALVSTELIELL